MTVRFGLGVALRAAAAAMLIGSGVAAAEETTGRDAYLEYCASCHGPEGKGDGPMAAELKKKPANLTRLAQKHGSPLPKDRLLDFIDGRDMVRSHGSREMPVWGKRLIENVPPGAGTEAYKRGTLRAILDWIDTIQVR
jgi:mono/diheme cytochrome c family protein